MVWKRQLPSSVLVLLLPVFLLPVFLSLSSPHQPFFLYHLSINITPWFESCSCCYGVHTLAWSAVVNSYTMMSHLIDMVFVQPHPWRKKSVSFSFKCLLHCSGKKVTWNRKVHNLLKLCCMNVFTWKWVETVQKSQWTCKESTHPFRHLILSSTLIMSWKSKSRATEIISNCMHICLYSTQ